jgi:hypothetical protein
MGEANLTSSCVSFSEWRRERQAFPSNIKAISVAPEPFVGADGVGDGGSMLIDEGAIRNNILFMKLYFLLAGGRQSASGPAEGFTVDGEQ